MNKTNIKLMTHVVAGYPNRQECLSLMGQMSDLGVSGIEVQIPFSDPIADGSVIVDANSQALEDSVTIDDVFKMLRQFRRSGYTTPLLLMSYANKVRHYGYERFCKAAFQVGVSGVIIPDLPVGTEEYKQLFEQLSSRGLHLVPVLSPGMEMHRLEEYLTDSPRLVYVTSTRGITGGHLQVTKSLRTLLSAIRDRSDANIVVGFGIRSAADILALGPHSDAVVIGSALIKEIQLGGINRAAEFLRGITQSIR